MEQTKFNGRLWSLCSFILCCLAGCKTTRKAETSKFPESTRYLSSKVRLTVPTKDAVFTVNGTMKLISGERMQLSFLMPIIRTEVARMEVTPEEILLVDRMATPLHPGYPWGTEKMCYRRRRILPDLEKILSDVAQRKEGAVQEKSCIPSGERQVRVVRLFPTVHFLTPTGSCLQSTHKLS